jgi:hypothetical protein
MERSFQYLLSMVIVYGGRLWPMTVMFRCVLTGLVWSSSLSLSRHGPASGLAESSWPSASVPFANESQLCSLPCSISVTSTSKGQCSESGLGLLWLPLRRVTLVCLVLRRLALRCRCGVWDREAVVSAAIVAGKVVSVVEELEELLTFDRLSL